MINTGSFCAITLACIVGALSLPTNTRLNDLKSATDKEAVIGCRKQGISYPIGISYDEIRTGLNASEVLLIDIRQPWELRKFGQLEGSVNLPLQELEEAFKLTDVEFREKYNFTKPIPGDEKVILTCRSGRRVVVAFNLLEPKGYCNIRIYFGSFLDWQKNGGPLIFP